ncbi:MAG: hypothetical protein ACRDU4_00470, partial [Mycobacterium sp.]
KDVDAGMFKAAQIVAKYAKQNAGWSRRIPRTIRVRRIKLMNITVQAGGPDAPHARVFEPSNGRAVRHPVFARGPKAKWTWVTQKPKPFMAPALARARKDIVRDAMDGIDQALGKVKK